MKYEMVIGLEQSSVSVIITTLLTLQAIGMLPKATLALRNPTALTFESGAFSSRIVYTALGGDL